MGVRLIPDRRVVLNIILKLRCQLTGEINFNGCIWRDLYNFQSSEERGFVSINSFLFLSFFPSSSFDNDNIKTDEFLVRDHFSKYAGSELHHVLKPFPYSVSIIVALIIVHLSQINKDN